MRDKRKFPRVDERWQVSYRVLDKEQYLDAPIRQYTVNISGGGICFTSEAEIELNSMVALDLESPLFPSPILALAKVVRCKRTRQGHEIGAEFSWVGWQNDDAQKAMGDYIVSATHGKGRTAKKSSNR